jgi:hypothetical protein
VGVLEGKACAKQMLFFVKNSLQSLLRRPARKRGQYNTPYLYNRAFSMAEPPLGHTLSFWRGRLKAAPSEVEY